MRGWRVTQNDVRPTVVDRRRRIGDAMAAWRQTDGRCDNGMAVGGRHGGTAGSVKLLLNQSDLFGFKW